MYDNVYTYHSNSQLTRWVGVNGPVYVGKEDKQVSQYYYVTSLEKLYWWKSTIWQHYPKSVVYYVTLSKLYWWRSTLLKYEQKNFCVKFCTHAFVYHTLVVCPISTSILHPLLCCKEDVGMDEAFYNPLQSPPLFLCLWCAFPTSLSWLFIFN